MSIERVWISCRVRETADAAIASAGLPPLLWVQHPQPTEGRTMPPPSGYWCGLQDDAATCAAYEAALSGVAGCATQAGPRYGLETEEVSDSRIEVPTKGERVTAKAFLVTVAGIDVVSPAEEPPPR